MTILDKVNKEPVGETKPTEAKKPEQPAKANDSSESNLLNAMESQFERMMEEFRANAGFSVDTGEKAVSTQIELLSSVGTNLSIVVLLAYIRHCINHGLKKDITVKIGYNKPPAIPMNFAVNDEMIEERYPSDVVEIN